MRVKYNLWEEWVGEWGGGQTQSMGANGEEGGVHRRSGGLMGSVGVVGCTMGYF